MSVNPSAYSELTRKILGAAIEVHRNLGPGLLESAYEQCLELELAAQKLRFARERVVPIIYKGNAVEARYRIDLIVEDRVVIEVKAVTALERVHEAQVLTYLRLSNCPVGLLINFNVPRLIDGVKRLLNARFDGEASRGN
jgi:GxxExxY protein